MIVPRRRRITCSLEVLHMLDVFDETKDGPWGRPHAAHLLRRMMIGATPLEITRAVAEGRERTIDRLLRPWEVPMDHVAQLVDGDVMAEIQPIDIPEYRQFFDTKDRRYIETVQWWAGIMIRGEFSAQERLTLWWHMCIPSSFNGSHFAENIIDQNKTMRQHCMGNVRTMVDELVHGMALQIYLSGTENVWKPDYDGINENLARELLELFLLGRRGSNNEPNYTQYDITQIARALSGLRIQEYHRVDDKGIDYLYRKRRLQFREDHWDPQEKTIFGHQGAFKSTDVLDILFTTKQQQIAYHICSRWYQSFVNEVLADDVVAAMADILLANDMNIEPVIRAVLNSSHFYEASNRMSISTPASITFLGQLRYAAVGYIPDLDDVEGGKEEDLFIRLRSMGQCMYYPPNVSGWPTGMSTVSGSSIAWRLEQHRRLWQGKLYFKDYPGGRQVYPIESADFNEMYGREVSIKDLAALATVDLLGLSEAEAKQAAEELCADLPGDQDAALRQIMTAVTTSPRMLFS